MASSRRPSHSVDSESVYKRSNGRNSSAVLKSFASSVGDTPVVDVVVDFGIQRRAIGIKLEGENPCGSIKDRTALELLSSFVPPQLDTATALVESTSGNIGVAMAHIAHAMDLEFRAVVDPKLPASVLKRLKSLGAQVDTVVDLDERGGYLTSRIERVREICAETPGAVWANQYANPANPLAHYRGTAPEIDRQTGGRVDAVFVAVSTGGTLAGISRYFRETRPDVLIIGVDVVGSVVFDDRPGPRRLSGIGASRKSDFLGQSSYDDFVLVTDEVAFSFCRSLRDSVGLHVGGSSGAVIAGCVRYLAQHPAIRHPVCVSADTGLNYSQTIFNDGYLRSEGIVLRKAHLRPLPDSPPVVFTQGDE